MPRYAILLAVAAGVAVHAHPQTQPAAILSQYCVTCHNDRLKTGGLILSPNDLTAVPAHAETWEKAVRKLLAGAMPPPGAPKPDAATAGALRSFLEGELDRAASAHP